MKKCVIVGAGDFFEGQINVNNDSFVIAADGGLKSLVDLGITPDLVIGDMDSLENKEYLDQALLHNTQYIKLPCEKDDTDMLAGIRIALKKDFHYFEIYGALGGRLDHTISNIQVLKFLKNNDADGVIIDRKVKLMMLHNETKYFDNNDNGRFSVFAFGGQAKGVYEKGFKYEINDATLDTDYPIGVSNEFYSEQSSISVTDGTLLLYIERD